MRRGERQVERVEFAPEEPAVIIRHMDALSQARDGWINLMPKSTASDRPTLGFFTLFGGGGTGVTMCTWIPAGHDRKAPDHASVGINHASGLRAVAQLQAPGITIPDGWRVEQDHPRRGLVLTVPAGDPNEQVLEWTVRATRAALTATGHVGIWRAEIHHPLDHDVPGQPAVGPPPR